MSSPDARLLIHYGLGVALTCVVMVCAGCGLFSRPETDDIVTTEISTVRLFEDGQIAMTVASSRGEHALIVRELGAREGTVLHESIDERIQLGESSNLDDGIGWRVQGFSDSSSPDFGTFWYYSPEGDIRTTRVDDFTPDDVELYRLGPTYSIASTPWFHGLAWTSPTDMAIRFLVNVKEQQGYMWQLDPEIDDLYNRAQFLFSARAAPIFLEDEDGTPYLVLPKRDIALFSSSSVLFLFKMDGFDSNSKPIEPIDGRFLPGILLALTVHSPREATALSGDNPPFYRVRVERIEGEARLHVEFVEAFTTLERTYPELNSPISLAFRFRATRNHRYNFGAQEYVREDVSDGSIMTIPPVTHDGVPQIPNAITPTGRFWGFYSYNEDGECLNTDEYYIYKLVEGRLTRKDAFRCVYQEGRFVFEDIGPESHAD